MEIENATTALRKINYKRWTWLRGKKPFVIISDPKVIAASLMVNAEALDEVIYRAQRRIKVSIVPILNGVEIDPKKEEFETMGSHLGNLIWPDDADLCLVVHKEPIEIKINPNKLIQLTLANAINSLPENKVGACMSEIDQECVDKLKAGDRAIFVARFWKEEFMHFGVLLVV